jgi:hypothetical protein
MSNSFRFGRKSTRIPPASGRKIIRLSIGTSFSHPSLA